MLVLVIKYRLGSSYGISNAILNPMSKNNNYHIICMNLKYKTKHIKEHIKEHIKDIHIEHIKDFVTYKVYHHSILTLQIEF